MTFSGAFVKPFRPAFDAGLAMFSGSYDTGIPNLVAAYGLRRLRSAYSGNLLKLRRSSDNAENDFGFTLTGDIDSVAISSWLNGATGYVTTWYDQTGFSRHAVQNLANLQFSYVANQQNGKPVLRVGLGHYMSFTGVSTHPSSILAVAKRIGSEPEQIILGINTGVHVFLAFSYGQTKFRANGGSDASLSGYGSGFVLLLGRIPSSGSKTVYRNGLDSASASLGSSDLWNRIGMGSFNALNGDVAEIVIANASWTDEQIATAKIAANSYWAIY